MPHAHARRSRRHRKALVLISTVTVAAAAAVVAGSANLLPVGHRDSAAAAELGASQAGSLIAKDPDADRVRRGHPRPRPRPSTTPSPIPTMSDPASTPSSTATSSAAAIPDANLATGSLAGIYWGVVGDPAGAMNRSGQTLAVHTYSTFESSVPTGRMITVRAGSGTWAQVAGSQPGSTLYSNIARWADTLKQRGQRTLLAYHHEPELQKNQVFGDASQYAKAFQRVVSIFRARGATNVQFVWQMTDWAFRTSSTDRQYAAKWYPGDSVVDIVGADAYNWYTCGHGQGRWMSLESLFGPTVAFARAHGKQAALPEFGSVSDGRRADWLRAAATYMSNNDQTVAAAFYFNHKPTNPANYDCTWPLTTQSEFSALGAVAGTSMFMS
jgi:Glycosyl hydrolase family 26